MRIAILLAVLLSLRSPSVYSQAIEKPTRLQWEHDHPWTPQRFELAIDEGPMQVLTSSLDGPYTFSAPFPALTPGRHTLTVFACNATGCSESERLRVRVRVETEP